MSNTMKTLVIFGSPRRNGDTAYLVKRLLESLGGEHMTVDCYHENISPCIDCRACRKSGKCSINDGMQKVYDYLDICDNIVIASPIYFSELTGRLLDVCSRYQLYFSQRRFRGISVPPKNKKGGVILVGGGSGGKDKAFSTAKEIFRMLSVSDVFPPVCSPNTDTVPAKDDKNALAEISELAEFLGSEKNIRADN